MNGTITALTTQKRNQERINVFIDGAYAFSLDQMTAASLSVGQFLSDAEIDSLQSSDDVAQALEKAVRYLAARPRSISEVRQNLYKKDFDEAIIETVIDRLIDLGYVDDEAFAKFWVQNRDDHNPRGAKGLRYELKQKGIETAIIDRVLVDFDAADAADRAARGQLYRYRNISDTSEFRRKMGGFLMRRGFNYEVVRSVIDTLIDELSLNDNIQE